MFTYHLIYSRRYRLLHFKNAGADATAPHSMLSHNTYGQQRQRNLFHHTPSARNFAFINRAFDLRYDAFLKRVLYGTKVS